MEFLVGPFFQRKYKLCSAFYLCLNWLVFRNQIAAYDGSILLGDRITICASYYQFAPSARIAPSRASFGTLDVYDACRLQPMGAPANSRLFCMHSGPLYLGGNARVAFSSWDDGAEYCSSFSSGLRHLPRS